MSVSAKTNDMVNIEFDNTQFTRLGGSKLLVHKSGIGDIENSVDLHSGPGWANYPIEGFAIIPCETLLEKVTCKWLNKDGEWSEWQDGSNYIGTEGLGQSIYGFSIKIKDETLNEFDVHFLGEYGNDHIIFSSCSGDENISPNKSPLLRLEIAFFQRKFLGTR